MNARKKKLNWRAWLVPAGLIFLSLVPALAGTSRLIELSSGAEVTEANARFFASPLPVVLHIISVTLYSIVGAFQFSTPLRHWRPRWHRLAGWFLVPGGLVAALSGLWMTQFYPWPAGDGVFLYWQRIFFGLAMLLALLLGILAIRQRNYRQHGAWMIRAYAIGLGAGTQVFTHIPWFLLGGAGAPPELLRALMMGAGWVMNLLIAEWVIRKRPSLRQRSSSATLSKPASKQEQLL